VYVDTYGETKILQHRFDSHDETKTILQHRFDWHLLALWWTRYPLDILLRSYIESLDPKPWTTSAADCCMICDAIVEMSCVL
jgi:hypothetical protein